MPRVESAENRWAGFVTFEIAAEMQCRYLTFRAPLH